MNWDVIIIGAGAAGLLAAIRAAEEGRRTLLLEKNRKAGVKILMSGGSRCNLTHACDRRGIIEAYGDQGKFLHSALAGLGPQELVDLIEAEGVPTKVEETGKIFPVSNKSSDILFALLRRLERSGGQLALGEPLQEMTPSTEGWTLRTSSRELLTRHIILTTGGQSYPGCGTVGDGYRWATKLGHTIVTPRPALVPLTLHHAGMRELSGITLPDVEVRIKENNGSALAVRRGSFLFTHFGCSGPVAMDVSRAVTGHPDPSSLLLVCDWLPELPAPQIDDQLKQASATMGKKQLAAVLGDWLPQRVAAMLLAEAGFATDRKAAALSKTERQRLVQVLKGTPFRITGTLGFAKAEVTAGGIDLAEVDSRTMQSKLAPGLFIAGEVLDLDGPIGGYNFQAAFSTGWLAGRLGQR
jgi:predicted Rossmann fold flavoprotein